MSHRARLVWLVLWPIGACFVVFGELGFWLHGFAPRETFPIDLGVSSVAIVCGLLVWRLRPGNPTGLLLYVAGAAWTVGGIRAYGNPWAFGLGQWFDGSQDLVFAHLLIAYPGGRLESRFQRALVGAGYSLMLVKLASTMTWVGSFNGFGVWNAPGLHSGLDSFANAAGGAYALIGIAIVSRRWWRASATARRVIAPVLSVAILFASADLLDNVYQAISGSEPNWIFFPPNIVRLVIPLAFALGLIRERLDQVVVSDLVIEIGTRGSKTIQEALARALQDPSVELGHRLSGTNEYVDAHGIPVHTTRLGADRIVTPIDRDGERLAVIVHDRALLEHPRLLESVAAATRLALDNERLQAQLRLQLEALRASRARLVQTADAERRRLERNLHDGAQQRLLGLGLVLQLLRNRLAGTNHDTPELLDEADAELQHALQELRELARGIHPAVLTDAGLPAAARALAARARIPVTVEADDIRFTSPVETAGYFLIAEALTNIARYAHATHAVVRISSRPGCAVVEVEDNGVGGADAKRGSGLAGLGDRVAALDGQLEITSDVGAGTLICAEFPCA